VIVKVPASRVVFATESGRKPTLIGNKIIDPILFDPFSTKLDSRDMQRLKTVTQKLKGEAGTLLVTGFVKYVGASKAVMVKIATERAKAVTKFLASLGIKVKIAYAGFGPHTTLNPNSSDRRVELRWASGQ
jgi:outer membrane protein OmpA-like peptidoglycan-associated protein